MQLQARDPELKSYWSVNEHKSTRSPMKTIFALLAGNVRVECEYLHMFLIKFFKFKSKYSRFVLTGPEVVWHFFPL